MAAGAESGPKYRLLADHYEQCLARFGDTPRGVDWPNAEDAARRYGVMLDVIPAAPATPTTPVTLLDFGCGASHLYEHIKSRNMSGIQYSGLDISSRFIELSREKFPEITYYCLDVLSAGTQLPGFDYVVINGVFTEKRSMTFDEMWDFMRQLIRKTFSIARRGLAFNVMSTHVDWKRDDLFHLPLDMLADFLVGEVSRSFVLRNDYGLYEYTAYIYSE